MPREKKWPRYQWCVREALGGVATIEATQCMTTSDGCLVFYEEKDDRGKMVHGYAPAAWLEVWEKC